MKTINRWVIVWAVLLGLLFVFSSSLAEFLWVLYFPVYLAPILGAVVLLVAIGRTAKGKDWSTAMRSLVILAIGLTLFFTCGFRIGRIALFQIRKGHYEAMLATATKTGTVPNDDGYIDDGPPRRYAFFFQRGVIDNWVGAVYDPSGEAGLDSNLFGGKLYRVETMGGGWYLCFFT